MTSSSARGWSSRWARRADGDIDRVFQGNVAIVNRTVRQVRLVEIVLENETKTFE